MKIECRGTQVPILKQRGIIVMTENERELIKLIRENDNQGQALVTAVNTILYFLAQHESSEVQVPADLQVLA